MKGTKCTGRQLSNSIKKAHLIPQMRRQQVEKLSDKEAKQFIPDAYKNVAKGMEKQFLQFMIEQMNKSVGAAGDGGTASNYYKNLLTKERADMMATHDGGSGIQDVILDQIYPKRMRNEVTFNAIQQQSQRKFGSKPIQMEGPQREVNSQIQKKNPANIKRYEEQSEGGQK